MFLKNLGKNAKIFISKISLRLRLTLIFVLLFGSVTVIFNWALYRYISEALKTDFDDALFNYAIDISESIEISAGGGFRVQQTSLDKNKIFPFSLGTALIQVRDQNGEILARLGDFGKFNPDFKRAFAALARGEEAHFESFTHIDQLPDPEANSYRVINFPIDNNLPPQVILQIAVPMSFYESQMTNRRLALYFGIPFILILATLGGWYISGRAMEPIRRMINATQSIEASDLGTRLPLPEAEDEIRDLALTINQMLDRIQRAFSSQERFVADASHQLLTPLTILKNEIHTLSHSTRDGFENSSSSSRSSKNNASLPIKSFEQEVDALIKIVQDMLMLARVDAGLGALNFERVALDDLLNEVIEKVEGLAAKKLIKVRFDMKAGTENLPTALVDRDLFFHLILNLVENAIKYGPESSHVDLILKWTSDKIQILVKDGGPGITTEAKSLIFDRFARGKNAEKMSSGFGLGLAIAQKIAKLHDSSIEQQNILSSDGKILGSEFSLEIKNI